MRGRHSRLDMQPLPSLAQSQSGANHSSSRSPMALKFLIALCGARRTASVPNSQLDLDSVLRMVCWRRNTKALHFVKQSGALQAKSCSCSSRTSELPISALASSQNFSTYLVFEGRVENLGFRLLVAFKRRWFKDAIIGENDATRDVVLQLSKVAGPVVAHQGAHGSLRNRFDRFVHRGS